MCEQDLGLNSQSRLRFAPSPTGYLHIGGARTALFNWLLARQCGGKFVLRIEDTDRERSTQEAVDAITEGLAWLGIASDEEPVFQSKRIKRHLEVVDTLIGNGTCYPCFCKPQRLEEMREQARSEGRDFVYDGCCRKIPPEQALARMDHGDPYVLRFRMPDSGVIEFNDVIGGHRSMNAERLGDFVVVRSDHTPVFHMSVVVDDHDMGITHILRGDDHLVNTFRQVMIYRAMDWELPVYGHMPMIQGPDRTRLSKRHGATNVMSFEQEGFLSAALVNFLALLGWSFDDSTEIMTREELIERFSAERINHSAAIFDRDKLLWMNGMYLRNMPREELVETAREFFRRGGLSDAECDANRFPRLVEIEAERCQTLVEMREHLDYFFVDAIESYDEKGVKKHMLKDGAIVKFEQLEEELAVADDFREPTLEPLLRALAEKHGEGFGKYVHLLRLATTGRMVSPGIFDVLEGLGRAETLKRLRAARLWIAAQQSGEENVS